jgi:hypothetical protein
MSLLPSLRTRIAGAFNDDELKALCFDHYGAVGDAFTVGMTKPHMIQLLLDHCIRRQLGSVLLDVLEQERPGLIGVDREALLAQLDAARLDETPLDAPCVLSLPLGTIPDVAPLPSDSRMSLARNPLFVGREANLKQLATILKGGETVAIGQIAAATGLGGIGKTNLATEFAHRYGQFFAGGVCQQAEVVACS